MPDSQTKRSKPADAQSASAEANAAQPETAEAGGDASLIDDVFQGLRALTRLKVVTVVGRADLEAAGDGPASPAAAFVDDAERAMVTQIDLVAGDITTIVDPELAGRPDDPLAALHAQNVAAARAHVAGNVELALDVMARLAQALQHRDAALRSAGGRTDGG
jgi:hypothetical protein